MYSTVNAHSLNHAVGLNSVYARWWRHQLAYTEKFEPAGNMSKC